MSTLMRHETAEIPDLVRAQMRDALPTYSEAARRFRDFGPALAVTVARGSSDNAALFFKYLCELETGIPVASVGPSVASVYGRRLALGRAACLSISQSGRSPDLVAFQKMAGEAGALRLALVNTLESLLAAGADEVLPVASGAELAVAATKSFALSLTAVAALVAEIAGNREIRRALDGLPERLEAAIACDWPRLLDALSPARSLYVIGRGPALAIAQEAALKFKETCQLHAESYSSAEVLHGPIQLAASGLTALVFVSRDASRSGTIDAVRRMAETGIDVFVVDPEGDSETWGEGVVALPCAAAPMPLLDPVCQIVSFYVFVERLAARLSLDPDQPGLLRKVTETV